MKKSKVVNLIICAVVLFANNLNAQTGYYDAPYVRYEADSGTLTNATVTAKSYKQSDVQSEASNQVCVNLSGAGASVEWIVAGGERGLVVRYSIPDSQTGALQVYADNILVDTLNLTTYYSWENLGFTNTNPKMRFDEVRTILPAPLTAGGSLKLVWISGTIALDFAELEAIPASVSSSPGDIVYTGDGSDLQTVINSNGGKTIYLPAGLYNVNRELYFGVNNTVLKGAGMWYTEIHFTEDNTCDGGSGGLRANASGVSYSGLYLTTVRNSRSCSYKAINGVYTSASTITNIWAEHFECGAWIAQFNTGGPAIADGFTMSYCRFRNNFADGTNLSKGTINAIVEHCNYRNNGDDDMAIWSANGLECKNNTFRYNTSEHCWRSAGCAIYGGYSNKAQHLIIKDNVEVGIRVNNSFSGVGFNDNGMHEFSDITVIGCGTFNDLWNVAVGAIDLVCDNVAGTRVKNVKFSNINIIDSKNDAIYFFRKNGEGFYNFIFENITVNGTGREYPYNNANNLSWGRGYAILYVANPSGNAVYCNMTYKNRGGNATTDINNAQIGTFSWTPMCITANTPVMTTSPTNYGICNLPITLSATATPPSANTVNYVEFFVDNVSVGQVSASPYNLNWSNSVGGSYQVKAIAYYTPSGTVYPSLPQTLSIADGLYTSATAPIIDGTIDALWSNYASLPVSIVSQGSFTGPADLTATYKVARDASNFYILVDVTDDILKNNNPGTPWQNDAVEIFIDMGNDKSGSYVANNDFQWSFIWSISTQQSGITFAQTTKANNLGYIMEIRIPWSTLHGAQADGTFIGFDLHVDDNDTGTRDGKKAWTDGTDNAWQSTAVLGTLQIAGCSMPVLAVDPAAFTDKGFKFYPNPFTVSGNLILTSGNENFSVRILDINGRLVWEKDLAGDSSYTVGEQLPSGVYILEISEGNSKQTSKLIKL
jgi:hypothetical protein